MKNLIKSPLLLFGLVAVLLAGCYPGGPEYYSDYDVVATNYYEGYDFAQNKTYFMPDTLIHIVDPEDADDVDHSRDHIALQRIEENMANNGYQRLESDTFADVILLGSVLRTTNVNIWYGGGGGYWWDWYPWYPGYGWGGGWYYPSYPVITTYDKGTLLLEMVDPDEGSSNSDTTGVAVWLGIGNGMLSSSTVNNVERTKKLIDDMFIHSEYLNVNQ